MKLPALYSLLLLSALSAGAQQKSHTCRFSTGPLAGHTQVLSAKKPITIGSPCTDGKSSVGVGVADSVPESGLVHPWKNGTSTPATAPSGETSYTCAYNSGPLAGQTVTDRNGPSTMVGLQCTDGHSSRGVAVEEPPD